MIIYSNFIVPLLLTIAIESVTAFLLGYRGKKFFFVLVLVNMITNPLLNYVLILIPITGRMELYYPVQILLETGVILAEWKLFEYALSRKSKSYLLLSTILNLISYLCGLLIYIVLFSVWIKGNEPQSVACWGTPLVAMIVK